MLPAPSEMAVGSISVSPLSVFNLLMAELPETEKILQSAGLPAVEIKDNDFNSWRKTFLKHLNRLAETPWSESKDISVAAPLKSCGGTNVTLTLYLVPGQNPADLFAPFLADERVNPINSNRQAGLKNTLIGLIVQQPFDT